MRARPAPAVLKHNSTEESVLGTADEMGIVAERALSPQSPVFLVTPPQWDEVVDVVCDAFRSYPTLLFVLGHESGSLEARMKALVRFFVMARVFRNEPILGVGRPGAVDGVALVSNPQAAVASADLSRLREETWAALGAGARTRYERFGDAGKKFVVQEPHLHLNILAVRDEHQGSGFGRRLLQAVHRLAAATPGCTGVSLTTETAANVSLYEYFGYVMTGHERVGDGLETWGFFRRTRKDDGA